MSQKPPFRGDVNNVIDILAYEDAVREWEGVQLAKAQELAIAAGDVLEPLAGLFDKREPSMFQGEIIEGPAGPAGPKGADGADGGDGPVVITRITAPAYTVIDSDREIFGNTDTNAITVTLQPGTQGRRLRLVNTGTSRRNLTITPDGAEHLIGANSSFALRDGETLILVYDATDGWY